MRKIIYASVIWREKYRSTKYINILEIILSEKYRSHPTIVLAKTSGKNNCDFVAKCRDFKKTTVWNNDIEYDGKATTSCYKNAVKNRRKSALLRELIKFSRQTVAHAVFLRTRIAEMKEFY